MTAYILGGISFLLIVGSFVLQGSVPQLARFADPWNFVAIPYWFLAGYGTARKSRIMAMLLLLLYVFAVITGIDSSAGGVGPMGLVFVILIFYFLVQAVRGTFSFHRLMKEEDPSYRATKVWHVLVGTPALALIAAITVFGIADALGWLTSTRVMAGDDLSTADVAELHTYEIILPTETVRLIYAPTLSSVSSRGYLITADKFIAYAIEEASDATHVYELPLKDIQQVEVLAKGHDFADTLVEITLRGEEHFEIELPITDGGDAKFINLLRSQISVAGREAS